MPKTPGPVGPSGDDYRSDIYTDSVREWADAYQRFLAEPDWPDADGVPRANGESFSAGALRTFWEDHGCVQCWFETHLLLDTPEKQPRYGRTKDHVTLLNSKITAWLTDRLDNWEDPGTRDKPARGQKTCYACPTHSKREGQAAVGIGLVSRKYNVYDLGHTVWAYKYPLLWQQFLKKETAPWRTGEFAKTTDDGGPTEEDWDDLDHAWSGVWDEYRLLRASNSNFEEAYLRGMEQTESSYGLIANNCQAACWYIMDGYGVDHLPEYYPPDPTWYRTIGGTVHQLPDPRNPASGSQVTPAPARSPRAPRSRALKSASAPEPETADVPSVLNAPALDLDDLAVNAVYRLDTTDTLHLTPHCPALAAAQDLPTVFGVPPTSDLDALAEQEEGPICGQCLRSLAAVKRVYATEQGERCYEVLSDRVRETAPAFLDETYFAHVRKVDPAGPSLFSSTPRVKIIFDRFLPGGTTATGEFDWAFGSVQERDACLAVLLDTLDAGS